MSRFAPYRKPIRVTPKTDPVMTAMDQLLARQAALAAERRQFALAKESAAQRRNRRRQK